MQLFCKETFPKMFSLYFQNEKLLSGTEAQNTLKMSHWISEQQLWAHRIFLRKSGMLEDISTAVSKWDCRECWRVNPLEMPGDDNHPFQLAYGTPFPGIALFLQHLKRSWNCGNFVIPLNLGTAAHSPVTELTAHGMEPLDLTMLRCFMIFISFSLHVFWFSPSHCTVW